MDGLPPSHEATALCTGTSSITSALPSHLARWEGSGHMQSPLDGDLLLSNHKHVAGSTQEPCSERRLSCTWKSEIWYINVSWTSPFFGSSRVFHLEEVPTSSTGPFHKEILFHFCCCYTHDKKDPEMMNITQAGGLTLRIQVPSYMLSLAHQHLPCYVMQLPPLCLLLPQSQTWHLFIPGSGDLDDLVFHSLVGNLCFPFVFKCE